MKKAVFPVAGLELDFCQQQRRCQRSSHRDKPLIQYAAGAVGAGIDTFIWTGRNKRAIEDHFDANSELEYALREKGQFAQLEMVHNILPKGVECIFVRQARQLGLGHAILCAERTVGNEPFAVLLADDFLTGAKNGMMENLVNKYHQTGNAQISFYQ